MMLVVVVGRGGGGGRGDCGGLLLVDDGGGGRWALLWLMLLLSRRQLVGGRSGVEGLGWLWPLMPSIWGGRGRVLAGSSASSSSEALPDKGPRGGLLCEAGGV